MEYQICGAQVCCLLFYLYYSFALIVWLGRFCKDWYDGTVWMIVIGLYDFMIFYDEIYVNAKIEGLRLYGKDFQNCI
jgi:hypothetical protein